MRCVIRGGRGQGQLAAAEAQGTEGDRADVGADVQGAVRGDVDGIVQDQGRDRAAVIAEQRHAGVGQLGEVRGVGAGGERLAEDTRDTDTEAVRPAGVGHGAGAAGAVTEAGFEGMPAAVDATGDGESAAVGRRERGGIIQDDGATDLDVRDVVDVLTEGHLRAVRDEDLTGVSPGLIGAPDRIRDGRHRADRGGGGQDVGHLQARGGSEGSEARQRGTEIVRHLAIGLLHARGEADVAVAQGAALEIEGVASQVRAEGRGVIGDDRGIRAHGGAAGVGIGR